MTIKNSGLMLWVSIFGLLAMIVIVPVHAEVSLDVKALLRQGMKECREAKTQRRLDLGGAQARFKMYIALLQQSVELEPTLLNSDDSTVRRVLDFCNGVKKDLDRAEALPMFEQGLARCREARISLSNGAFDEARQRLGQYLQYKEAALALTESVLQVYENSYELGLCEHLSDDITLAEEEYRKQALVQAESQQQFNDILGLFNEALNQCRGMQNIISDKARYTSQTINQLNKLVGEARTTKKEADEKLTALEVSGVKLSEKDTQRIRRLNTSFVDCEKTLPEGMALVTAALQAQLRQSAQQTAAGTDNTSVVKKDLPSSEYVQIVGVPAKYPANLARRGIEGFVEVRFTITKTGDVADIQVVESQPEGLFDRTVFNAVSRYKYQPRIVKGEPVDAPGVVAKLTFKLK